LAGYAETLPLVQRTLDGAIKSVPGGKMQFILTGFAQDGGFRVFAFEGIASGNLNVTFTVRANLDLSRRYGIRLQDLPLICREVLEHREEGEQERTFTFTEDAMRSHASRIAAAKSEAALNRKPPRRPVHAANGSNWGSNGQR
jgi:hypothetical protein